LNNAWKSAVLIIASLIYTKYLNRRSDGKPRQKFTYFTQTAPKKGVGGGRLAPYHCNEAGAIAVHLLAPATPFTSPGRREALRTQLVSRAASQCDP
jgi:hypothetical protein